MSSPKNHTELRCLTCGKSIFISSDLAALLTDFRSAMDVARSPQDRTEIQVDFADSFFHLGYRTIPLFEE